MDPLTRRSPIDQHVTNSALTLRVVLFFHISKQFNFWQTKISRRTPLLGDVIFLPQSHFCNKHKKHATKNTDPFIRWSPSLTAFLWGALFFFSRKGGVDHFLRVFHYLRPSDICQSHHVSKIYRSESRWLAIPKR